MDTAEHRNVICGSEIINFNLIFFFFKPKVLICYQAVSNSDRHMSSRSNGVLEFWNLYQCYRLTTLYNDCGCVDRNLYNTAGCGFQVDGFFKKNICNTYFNA